MANLERVTFIPGSAGGRLQASLQSADHELTGSWPVGEQDGAVSSLLDRLMVTVQEVTYVAGSGGSEIQVMLQIGNHRYVATFALDESSGDLQTAMDSLMDAVAKQWVNTVQAMLSNQMPAATAQL